MPGHYRIEGRQPKLTRDNRDLRPFILRGSATRSGFAPPSSLRAAPRASGSAASIVAPDTAHHLSGRAEGEEDEPEHVESEDEEEEEPDESSDEEDPLDDAPELEKLSECMSGLCRAARDQLTFRLRSSSPNGDESISAGHSGAALPNAMEAIGIKLRNHAKVRQSAGEDPSSWIWTGEVKHTDYATEMDNPSVLCGVGSEVCVVARDLEGDEKVQCTYTARSTRLPDTGWSVTLISRNAVDSAWNMRTVDGAVLKRCSEWARSCSA